MEKSKIACIITTIAVICWILSCAPGREMYHVKLKYEPMSVKPLFEAGERKHVTVAFFRDARTIDDPVKMGWVSHPKGRRWVMPEEKYPDVAVTEAVREYLKSCGVSVEAQHPRWDLTEESIEANWGHIILGGAIEELEVLCDDTDRFNPVKKYQARVKLKVVLADGKRKKIVYRTEAEARMSLQDISCSPEKMEKLLNAALYEVLERIFAGKEMVQLLKAL
ncbi:MAG: hypothetical protein N2572_02110 [Syntrophales bacterium]|nr:hypothetical protein [Syntrophales bacterium]